MRNRYPGTCYRCGEWVKAGDGHFEKVTAAKRQLLGLDRRVQWLTQHALCAIRYRGTNVHFEHNPDNTTGGAA